MLWYKLIVLSHIYIAIAYNIIVLIWKSSFAHYALSFSPKKLSKTSPQTYSTHVSRRCMCYTIHGWKIIICNTIRLTPKKNSFDCLSSPRYIEMKYSYSYTCSVQHGCMIQSYQINLSLHWYRSSSSLPCADLTPAENSSEGRKQANMSMLNVLFISVLLTS